MAFIETIKNRLEGFLKGDISETGEGRGVHATIEELVREQFNIAGLDFFNTNSRNIMAGTSASPFKGKGMEFDEVRIYQAGDDVRTIDWRVTARRGETYTKLFREERERQVIILTDMRDGMHFGTRGMFKSVMAARLSALIAWAALDASEKVGGIVVSPQETTVIPPHRSRKKVLSLMNALSKASYAEAEGKAKSLALMLLELSRAARTGGIVFVISDFHDFDDTAKRYITQICGKCDLVTINVIDKLEEKAPPEDRYLVTDGRRTLTLFADDYLWREEYEGFFRAKREKFEDFCKKRGIRNIWVRTEENPADALRTAFAPHGKR